MAGATLTTIDAALKETWTEDRLAEQVYQDNPFLSRVRRLKTTQVGQQAVTPIHTGRNWGYTALPAAGGTLNAAGNQEITQATWQYTHHNVQVKIQGSAIDGTRGDALSVAEVVDLEVEGAVNDLNRQLTRQLFLNGDALVTACGVTSASTTVVLNVTDGFDALQRGWLAVGSVIDIGSTANEVSVAADRTITAITESESAPTVVISGAAVTTAATDYISLANSRSGTTSYEMNGLQNIVKTSGTLGGVSASSFPAWASPSVDATSQALTLPLMYTANRKVAQKTGKPTNYVVTSLKQQQNFYNLVQAQVRFAGDSGLAAGNVEGVSFNGMTVYAQPDCKNAHMWFLTVDDFLIVSAGDPYWQNKVAGANILNWIQGEDSYGAKITVRHNLGIRRRNSHSALTGLT